MELDRARLEALVEAADRALANLDNAADPGYPGFVDLRAQIVALRDASLAKLGRDAPSA